MGWQSYIQDESDAQTVRQHETAYDDLAARYGQFPVVLSEEAGFRDLQFEVLGARVDVLKRCHQNGGIPRRACPMPSLTIKDIPNPLLTRLRQRAATDQRSLNREVIHLLDRVLSEAPAAPASVALAERIEAQVRAWQTLAGRWDADREPAEEIGELYAARTPGRRVDL